jgi:hypothetical protein
MFGWDGDALAFALVGASFDNKRNVGCGVVIRDGSRTARIHPVTSFAAFLETLLAARLLLCSFDRDVPEEKLNLFELAASLMARPSTSALRFMAAGDLRSERKITEDAHS